MSLRKEASSASTESHFRFTTTTHFFLSLRDAKRNTTADKLGVLRETPYKFSMVKMDEMCPPNLPSNVNEEINKITNEIENYNLDATDIEVVVHSKAPGFQQLVAKRLYLWKQRRAAKKILEQLYGFETPPQNENTHEHHGAWAKFFDTIKKFIDVIDDVWNAIKNKVAQKAPQFVAPLLVGLTGLIIHLWEGLLSFQMTHEAWANKNIGQRKTRLMTGVVSVILALTGITSAAFLLAGAAGSVVGAAMTVLPVIIPAALTVIYGLSLYRRSYILHQAKNQEQVAKKQYDEFRKNSQRKWNELFLEIQRLEKEKNNSLSVSSDDYKNISVKLMHTQKKYAALNGKIAAYKQYYENMRQQRMNAEREVAFSVMEFGFSIMVLAGTILGAAALIGSSAASFGLVPLALLLTGVLGGGYTKFFESRDAKKNHGDTAAIRSWVEMRAERNTIEIEYKLALAKKNDLHFLSEKIYLLEQTQPGSRKLLQMRQQYVETQRYIDEATLRHQQFQINYKQARRRTVFSVSDITTSGTIITGMVLAGLVLLGGATFGLLPLAFLCTGIALKIVSKEIENRNISNYMQMRKMRKAEKNKLYSLAEKIERLEEENLEPQKLLELQRQSNLTQQHYRQSKADYFRARRRALFSVSDMTTSAVIVTGMALGYLVFLGGMVTFGVLPLVLLCVGVAAKIVSKVVEHRANRASAVSPVAQQDYSIENGLEMDELVAPPSNNPSRGRSMSLVGSTSLLFQKMHVNANKTRRSMIEATRGLLSDYNDAARKRGGTVLYRSVHQMVTTAQNNNDDNDVYSMPSLRKSITAPP